MLVKSNPEEAKKLLEGTPLPIKTVADHLGFRSAYYFSRLFKKKTGLSKTRRMQAAFADHLRHVGRMYPRQTYPRVVLLIDNASAGSRPIRTAATLGWAFGFGQFLLGLHWIGYAFMVDAAEHGWQIPFVVNPPVALSIAAFVVKLVFFSWVFIWIRWTLPRFRFDQLMFLDWKVMLPLSLGNMLLQAVLMYRRG